MKAGFRVSRRHRGLIAGLVAVLLVLGVAWQAAADNALPAPGWVLTATPTSGLLDGDTVTVNVRANPDVSVYRMSVRQCLLDASYTVEMDVSARSGKCPVSPVSSSADLVTGKTAANGLIASARTTAGADVAFRVGTGTTNWDTPTGSASLTCDVTTRCGLVVLVEVGPDVRFQVFPLTFSDSDPIVACGGLAAGRIQAASSDELADAWAKWTRDYCASTGSLAPSTTAFTGEGAAVTSFLGQGLDLAYGSSGLDPANGMVVTGTGSRATVAVPVALNAAVLAVGGGKRRIVDGNPADKAPYPEMQVTPGEAAALLSNGISGFQDDRLPYRASILAQNPALDGVAYWTGANVSAPSLPLTAVHLLSKYFTTVAPADWVYRRDDPPSSRGATASLAAAVPPFTDTALVTGRPAMGKTALAASLNDPDGPLWVFTDRATAASLKLVPAALQDPAGTGFVAPDSDTMTAAVTTMVADSRGVLQPVFRAPSASSGLGTPVVNPYPLTYVVYAFVPAEPLVDPVTCRLRSDSQQVLKEWLSYLTGPGQSKLAPGLEPLPASLRDEAVAAIARVGAAPQTGTCPGVAPDVPPAPAPVNPSPSPLNRAVASPIAAAPVVAAAAETAKTAEVTIPAFRGRRSLDTWGGVVSIGGIIVMMSLAAWTTAGGATAGAAGVLTARRIGSLALLWGGVGLASLGLVVYQLGPLMADQDQRTLLAEYRVAVRQGSFADQSLGGPTATVERAPERGSPVGILEIGRIGVQDVVVEGATSATTRSGPGHVPGTAGLGQPGNAVVVARRNGYGASFAGLSRLRNGDRIVVTTTQGQTVYEVDGVCWKDVVAEPDGPAVSTGPVATKAAPGTADCPPTKGSTTSADATTSTSSTTSVVAGDDPTAVTTAVPGSNPGGSRVGTSTTTVAAAVRSAFRAAAPAATSTSTTAPAASTTSEDPAAGPGTSSTTVIGAVPTTSGRPTATFEGPVLVDTLYGSTDADRLTLLTSAEKSPLNGTRATVVTARMLSVPFEPTVQGTRDPAETGFSGDQGVWPLVAIALAVFVGVVAGSVLLFRRMRFRTAYLISIAPLIAGAVLAGQAVARLLPAWM